MYFICSSSRIYSSSSLTMATRGSAEGNRKSRDWDSNLSLYDPGQVTSWFSHLWNGNDDPNSWAGLDEMKCSISGSLSPVPPGSRHQYKFLHPPLLTYVLNLSPKGQEWHLFSSLQWYCLRSCQLLAMLAWSRTLFPCLTGPPKLCPLPSLGTLSPQWSSP